MTSKSRNELYSSFKTGAKPTEQNFQDLIDSALNINDDGIISDGGKIGIGIKNPTEKLEIDGNLKATNATFTGTLAVTGNSTLTGNVGIGTTNPTEKLEVSGNLKVSGANTTSSALSVEQNGTGNAAYFSGGGGVKITSTITEDPALSVDQNNTNYTAYFTGGRGVKITSTITEDPALSVDQNSYTYAAEFKGGSGVRITGVRGDGSRQALTIDDINTEYSALSVNQNGTGNAAYFSGGAGVLITGNLIVENGNVGIGTTSPTEKLEVSGNLKATNANFTDTLSVTGNSTLTGTLTVALPVDQDDTGKAAYFTGGSGVMITGVRRENYALYITDINTPYPALGVDQNGTGYAAYFTGGSGVRIDGNLTLTGALIGTAKAPNQRDVPGTGGIIREMWGIANIAFDYAAGTLDVYIDVGQGFKLFSQIKGTPVS